MKKNLFLAVSGLAVTLGLGMTACQSSDTSGNGGDSTAGPTGAGGDTGGATAAGGTQGTGGNGTPGAGGMTPGAGGNGTPGAGGMTPGAGGNGTPGAGGMTPGAGGSGGQSAGTGGQSAGGAGGDATGGSGGMKACKEDKLFPGMAGMPSLFCPFSTDPMTMKNAICNAPTEHCCEGAAGDPSACEPAATPCMAGYTDWQCFDPTSDCAAGSVCCVYGAKPIVNNVDTMCTAMFPNNHFLGGSVQGTKCATSCDTTKELQVCETDAQCTSPMKCLPTTSKGAHFGVCGM